MRRAHIFSSSAFLVLLLPYFANSYDFLKPEVQSIYIKGVLCNTSEKFVHKNFSCFSKSYNRSFSTLNVIVRTKIALKNIFASASLQYKYGTIYREVIKVSMVDICKITAGIAKDALSNRFVAMIHDLMNDSAPGLVHPCPYNGATVRDCNVKTKSIPSIFPAGDYRFILSFYENTELVTVVNIIGTMISPLKENFGRK